MNKRFISFALSALLLLSGTEIVSASAKEPEKNTNYGIQSIVPKQQDNNSVNYYDQDGNEINIMSLNNDVNVDESALPSSYDLRDENRVTPVRNQGSQGLCWDFGATASIESNILTQKSLSANIESPAYKNLDLSEAGNTWYIHTPSADKNSIFSYEYIADSSKGTNGGAADTVASSLFCGFGTYPEELLPYDQWNKGYSSSLRFYSDYRLKEFTQLTYDTDLIKNKVIENGAVSMRYNCFTSNTYMTDDGMETYYDDGSSIEEYFGDAHIVAIVGWDDSFSKDNFNPAMQPESDGAWLCKNSWGEDQCSTAKGYEGYFWISYETDISEVTQFIMESNNEFDNIYQIQGVADLSISLDSAANVFTAQSDEVIKQVGLRNIGALDAEIEIYKLNDGYTSPTDGKKICQFSAKSDFAGIHMFDCPTEVTIATGDVFSVVVTNKGDEMFINLSNNSENEQSGLSYVKYSGDSWQDSSNTDDGFASIKVFTSNASGVADKTKLISLIESSTNLIDDDTIDKEFSDEIKQQCENSQKVVDDKSATQAQVNNAYYLLDRSVNKLSWSKIEINSVDDYYELSDISDAINVSDIKQITLNADLDFEGKEIPSLLGTQTFSGVFEGNNHKISNFTLESNNEYIGLFSQLDGAEIKNLTLSDCVAESEDSSQILAGTCTDTKFTNCKIDGAKIKSKSYAGAFSCDQSNVVVENCSVVNTKIYGNYIAGVFFGCYVELDSSCTYSNVELYSFSDIKNNIDKELNAFPSDDSPSGGHIISYVDDTFYIEAFTAKISSLTPFTAKVEKISENKYKVTDVDEREYVEVMYANNEDDFTATGDLETRKLYVNGYTGNDSDVVIPTTINGFEVVGFGSDFNSSISENGNVKSITVSGKIKNINECIFSYIYSLEKVTLCEGVETISSEAFSYCENLKSVKLPNSLKKIDTSAFAQCTNLSDINFNEGLESILNNAFIGCVSLTAPKLPDSLKEIGSDAFSGCTFMGVTLGKGIENIGENAFACTNNVELDYKMVYIPNFTINGYSSTAAKEYAEKYSFKFVDIENNTPAEFTTQFDYNVFLTGDVDLNGVVNVRDATLIMKWIANISDLTPIQKANALVGNVYDTIDVRNATLIQKYLAKQIDSLESNVAG
jgi:C1A family cysteine protease